MTTKKCIICERRPAREGLKGRCAVCNDRILKDIRSRKRPEPVKYLVYRGNVVGLFHKNGGDTLRAELLKRSEKYLPKSRTINLDRYCEGFTREQIKKFKSCVLSLANAN